MRNLNVETVTHWIATTSDLEALKGIRDVLAGSLRGLPTAFLQSVPAIRPGATPGNLNYRGILHWAGSVGNLTSHLKDGKVSSDLALVASVYNLILTRFTMHSVHVEQKDRPVTPPAAVK